MTTSHAPARSSTLADLRAVAQPPEFSPSITDRAYRVVSIFVSVPLARAGATPNGITLAWIALGLAGAAALAWPSWPVRVAGALVLHLSYLLDFVDGEVARLTDRRSRAGGFLDLLGHGVIKASLPLAVGWTAVAATGETLFLLAGAVGAVAIVVGDALRFYAACTAGDLAAGDIDHVVRPPRQGRRRTPGRVARALFDLSFETPGLYGLALVAAAADALPVLAGWWALGGVVWHARRAVRYCRRLEAGA
jgi:phosphatidylglycerophosphate synthase